MDIAKINGIPVEDIRSMQFDNRRYVMATTGRMVGKSNIQNISRDYQESEWLWQRCQEAERKNGHKLCDECHERFKCWTASRPQVRILGDTHIGLQRIQQCVKAQMITVDEASESFKVLSQQLCDAMTKRLDENVLG